MSVARLQADNLLFHHVYNVTKVETISNLRKKGILYDLTSCVPLCISCHNRFTHTIEDETKIDHASKIKDWHSLYNRPGYLFGYPCNVMIAAAVIVHREFVDRKTEGKKQKEQEYLEFLKAFDDIFKMHKLIFQSNSD